MDVAGYSCSLANTAMTGHLALHIESIYNRHLIVRSIKEERGKNTGRWGGRNYLNSINYPGQSTGAQEPAEGPLPGLPVGCLASTLTTFQRQEEGGVARN